MEFQVETVFTRHRSVDRILDLASFSCLFPITMADHGLHSSSDSLQSSACLDSWDCTHCQLNENPCNASIVTIKKPSRLMSVCPIDSLDASRNSCPELLDLWKDGTELY